MKTVSVILKILAALAAIAGVVYVVATYGDKIAAFARKLLAKLPGRKNDCCDCVCDCDCEDDCEECACEADCDACPCCEACAGEEIEEAEEEVAAEADFEG